MALWPWKRSDMSKKSEQLFNEIKAALAETGKDNSGVCWIGWAGI